MSNDGGARGPNDRKMQQHNAYWYNNFLATNKDADTQSENFWFTELTPPDVYTNTPGGQELKDKMQSMARTYMARSNEIRKRLLYTGRDATIVAGKQDYAPAPSTGGVGV